MNRAHNDSQYIPVYLSVSSSVFIVYSIFLQCNTRSRIILNSLFIQKVYNIKNAYFQICRAAIYIKVFDIAALRHCTCYFGEHHKLCCTHFAQCWTAKLTFLPHSSADKLGSLCSSRLETFTSGDKLLTPNYVSMQSHPRLPSDASLNISLYVVCYSDCFSTYCVAPQMLFLSVHLP